VSFSYSDYVDQLDRARTRRMAFDRAPTSGRRYDADGRMRLASNAISMAAVNGYLGREIPDYQRYGLKPNQLYMLLRDPDELEKAAPTFNSLPILSEHVPVDVVNPRQDLVIGSTGSNATFEDPYLLNSLVIWTAAAIKGIESNTQRDISSAYRYRADMTPGRFRGERYDGVMRDLTGNHVALVLEGRVAGVMVGDAKVMVGDAKPRTRRDSLADFYKMFPKARHLKIR